MSRDTYEGAAGLERLKGLIRVLFEARGKLAGTQEFVLGWLYGLADAGAVDEDALFFSQQFIAKREYADTPNKAVELYAYPNERFRRVEGKSLSELEREIMVGGPFEDSRIGRTYLLAGDAGHDLHFVARHYLFLTRARNASMTFGD